jgi:hypothetical protein
MTAINPGTGGEIPPAIALVEQMLGWALLTLHNLYKGVEYKEAQGTGLDSGTAPIVDVSTITAADGTTRLVGRVSLELHPDYVTGPNKLWTYIQAFGSVLVPNAYKVD